MNNDDVDKIGAPSLKKERTNEMRVNKAQAILYIFDMLKEQKYIIKSQILSELNISELTFWRYMQEIRAYIYNFNKSYDLKYNRSEDKYYLEER